MDIGVIITRLNRELAIANTMGSDAAEHRRLRIEPLESSLGVALDKLFDLDADAPLSIQGKFTSETDESLDAVAYQANGAKKVSSSMKRNHWDRLVDVSKVGSKRKRTYNIPPCYVVQRI